MQSYEIHLFADDGLFQLQDDDVAAIDSIAVRTARTGEIAVAVQVHAARPELPPARWERVDTASLRIDSGRVVVAGSAEHFPEAFRIPLRRGDYEALVCHGEDRCVVALYPAGTRTGDGSLRIERLAASHVQPYRAFMLRAYGEAPDAFTSTPEERAQEPDAWWLKRIADPAGRSVAFGCFEGTTLVGTVAVEFSTKPKTRHKAHLIGMFVSPEARGRGAARLLLEAALEHCRSHPDVTSVTLTVTQGNAPAIALYRRAGFREFGVEPMALRTGAGYLAKVHMQMGLREDV